MIPWIALCKSLTVTSLRFITDLWRSPLYNAPRWFPSSPESLNLVGGRDALSFSETLSNLRRRIYLPLQLRELQFADPDHARRCRCSEIKCRLLSYVHDICMHRITVFYFKLASQMTQLFVRSLQNTRQRVAREDWIMANYFTGSLWQMISRKRELLVNVVLKHL